MTPELIRRDCVRLADDPPQNRATPLPHKSRAFILCREAYADYEQKVQSNKIWRRWRRELVLPCLRPQRFEFFNNRCEVRSCYIREREVRCDLHALSFLTEGLVWAVL